MILTNRLLGVALIALALAGCATSSPGKRPLSKEERSQILLDAAAGAINDNDPVGALQILADAEKMAPATAALHHLRTLAFMQKNEPAEALAAARQALSLAPEVPEYQNNLGKLLIDSGRLGEAEGPLLKAAGNHLYREAFKANTNLGILYYRRGEEEKARERFAKASEQDPESACVAHYYLGHLNLRAARFRDAIRSYDRATRMACSDFREAHYALGLAYERSRQFEKARRKFLDISNAFPETEVSQRALDRLKNLP
jgi:type IV pilus assembly protein PilF